MTLINSIILALVEGLTEFLPVSSTAHLIFAERLMGLDASDSFVNFFTVFVQLGPILAALIFFRKKIIKILKTTFTNIKEKKFTKDMGLWILISILPTLAVAFLVKDKVNEVYSHPLIIAVISIFFGIVFYGVELLVRNKDKVETENIGFKNVFIMGLAQVLSLIPGVSRSGITVTGGIAQKMKFKDSIEISFIMSIPIMLIASGYEVVKNVSSFNNSYLEITGLGLLVSFLAGLVSVKITLGILQRNGFFLFMIYRIIFAFALVFAIP